MMGFRYDDRCWSIVVYGRLFFCIMLLVFRGYVRDVVFVSVVF